MAGYTAAHRQNSGRGVHAANILGRCFAPHKDAGLAARGTRLRLVCGQNNAPRRSTRTCANTAHDDIAFGARINLPVQHFGQRIGMHPHDRFVFGNDVVFGKFDRDLNASAV